MSKPAQAFLDHVGFLSAQAGVELDDDQMHELFRASYEGGFTSETTEQLFAQLVDRDFEDDDEEPEAGPYDEDDFDFADEEEEPDTPAEEGADPRLVEDVQYSLNQLTDKIGRQLTQREQEQAVRGALDRVRKGQFPDVAAALEDAGTPVKAVTDMSTHEHRDWARERFQELQEPKHADGEGPEHEYAIRPTADSTIEELRDYARLRTSGYEAEPTNEED